jgi:hypothetical protein
MGQWPTVGVVDDQQHAGGAAYPQILAARWRQDRAWALDSGDDLPSGVFGFRGELGRQPGLALPTGAVQPMRREPWAGVLPLMQPG